MNASFAALYEVWARTLDGELRKLFGGIAAGGYLQVCHGASVTLEGCVLCCKGVVLIASDCIAFSSRLLEVDV